jgi:hypothetical protein
MATPTQSCRWRRRLDGVKLGSELPWVRPGRYPLRTWLRPALD